MDEEERGGAQERPEFHIADEHSATWLARKLRQIEEEKAAVAAATARRLEELDADRAKLERRYLPELEAWARQEAERRHRKSVTLPLAGVVLSFRTVPAKPARLVVADKTDAADTALLLGHAKQVADLDAYLAAAQEALTARSCRAAR